MTDNELKDECMENAEIDLGRYSYKELTQIREAMRMYADLKLKLFAIPDVRLPLPSDKDCIDAIKHQVEQLGYEIVKVENGNEA